MPVGICLGAFGLGLIKWGVVESGVEWGGLGRERLGVLLSLVNLTVKVALLFCKRIHRWDCFGFWRFRSGVLKSPVENSYRHRDLLWDGLWKSGC